MHVVEKLIACGAHPVTVSGDPLILSVRFKATQLCSFSAFLLIFIISKLALSRLRVNITPGLPGEQ